VTSRKRLEDIMRKLVLAAIGAATIVTAGSMATRSEAMPIGPALRPAIEAVNPVERTACWRWGWHGPRYYYARPWPFWGWRWHHRHWRW
jgi:hypothetical protein